MKKLISHLLVLSFVAFLLLPIQAKATSYVRIVSISAQGNDIIVNVDSDVSAGYKITLYFSVYSYGNIGNPKPFTLYSNADSNDNLYTFKISGDNVNDYWKVYNFKAFIYDLDGHLTTPPYGSNELYKKITKNSSGLTIQDYEGYDTSKTTVKVDKTPKKKTISMYATDKVELTVKSGKKKIKSSKLRFKSSNKKIATINSKGVITAIKAGKVKITVKTKDKTQSCVIILKIKNKEHPVLTE